MEKGSKKFMGFINKLIPVVECIPSDTLAEHAGRIFVTLGDMLIRLGESKKFINGLEVVIENNRDAVVHAAKTIQRYDAMSPEEQKEIIPEVFLKEMFSKFEEDNFLPIQEPVQKAVRRTGLEIVLEKFGKFVKPLLWK